MDPVQDSAALPTSTTSSSSSLAPSEKQKGDTHHTTLVINSSNSSTTIDLSTEKGKNRNVPVLKESPRDVKKDISKTDPVTVVVEEKKDSQPSSSTNSQRKRRGGNGSRSSRGRRQAGKRGEWKKLDVEVSFNKNSSSANGGGASRRGGKGSAKTNPPKEDSSTDNPNTNNNNNNDDKDNNSNGNKSSKASSTSTSTSSASASASATERKGSNNRRGKGRNNSNHPNGYHRSNSDTPDSNPNWRKLHHHPRKNSKYNSSFSRRQQKQQNGNHSHKFPELTKEQLKKATLKAVSQVEFFFSNDELCRNTYLRNHMDVEGYLPAAIVFNFPSVVKLSVPYQDLMDAVDTSSEILDVDKANETLRLRENYHKWLYPNKDGGFGCPRWIKQPPAPAPAPSEPTEEGEGAAPAKKVEEESANDNVNGAAVTSDDQAIDKTSKDHKESNDPSSSTQEDKPEDVVEKVTNEINALHVDSTNSDDMRQ